MKTRERVCVRVRESVPASEAMPLAAGLVAAMRPYCERVQIAGSLRRGREQVGDIELVAIPRWEQRAGRALFGEEGVNLLHEWAVGPGREWVCWIKPATAEIVPWQPRPEGQYWRGLVGDGIKLDLLLASPESWGVDLLIRTGSAEWNLALMTYAKRRGTPFSGGRLRDHTGRPVPTPEEEDVFGALGLAWVEPAERTGAAALRGAG